MSALEIARKKISFDVNKLSHFIWEGEERFKRFMAFQKLCSSDPLLRNNPKDIGIGRAETYELYARKMKKLLEVADLRDIKEFATLIYPEALVSSLNYEMFMPTILNLGTDEQVKLFYEPASRWEILGCYSQTELAHGSDINRIETTATYDKQTKSFIINTPSLKATKWWGSDMGITATHVVTQAQLYIDGKRCGVQNFVVQIRDVKTHQTLPGVLVGDIGAKFGYNSKDNGYLRFDNVRIPKVNMLSKYVNVSDDGQFTKTGDDKVWHATMQLMRQHFLDSVWKCLGIGLTIVIRYSLQRKQFKDSLGQEIPIFDYQLQQHKLIPLIAEMYGCMLGSKKVFAMAQDNVARIKQKNDFSKMMEVHVVLSASKAYYTWNCFFALEKVRQCAGGHGYSYYSGIPPLITEMSPCVVAEGDNTVLSLSVGKVLLMYLNKAMQSGKAPNTTCDYLEDIFNYLTELKQPLVSKECTRDLNKVLAALRYNVAFNVANAGQKLQTLMGDKGLTFKEATDKHLGILLQEIAHTQSNYWTYRTFLEEVNALTDPNIKSALTQLCLLYGLNKILEQQGQLFEYGVLSGPQFVWIRETRDELISNLKDNALGLVEAIAYDDNSVRSAIGDSQGNPYEKLYHWAKDLNPLNEPEFHEQVFKTIKTIRTASPHAKL
ncbi:unnamed protein product [Paramecium octaurelia]|uniref:Acyl-coenzyme A oxidase n=1 Tax=Paramecium octaurelia TaxID=43137 RepID=A0A8S1TYV1_PAROT|nr:unnamed protein product [Paramecium octaurelia]